MGIDVHKMIGYGLTDVEHDGYQLTDPRINLSSPLVTYEADYQTYLSYLKTLKDGGDLHYSEYAILTHWKPELPPPDPQRSFVWDSEGGLRNVLVLSPVWMPDWRRRSDTIDWVEESHLYDQQNRVRTFTDGLYPFNAQYMDTRTGQRLSDDVMTYIRVRNDNQPGRFSQQDKDNVAAACTGMSWEEAGEFVMPVIPQEIVNLAACFELFLDQATLLQLRPMLYVWWS